MKRKNLRSGFLMLMLAVAFFVSIKSMSPYSQRVEPKIEEQNSLQDSIIVVEIVHDEIM